MEININNTMISGTITDLTFSHTVGGEGFYKCLVRSRRHSGNVDEVPLIISERLIERQKIATGNDYLIHSRICSRDERKDGRARLRVSLLVDSIVPIRGKCDCNTVELEGYICTEPVYKELISGTRVYRFMMATNHKNKSYYIPCVAFNGTAEWMQKFEVGDKLQVTGRIQSRDIVTSDFQDETVIEIAINGVRR